MAWTSSTGMAAALGVAVVASLAGGCSNIACLNVVVMGLSVTVTDGATGRAVCNAEIAATDGSYSEALMNRNVSGQLDAGAPA